MAGVLLTQFQIVQSPSDIVSDWLSVLAEDLEVYLSMCDREKKNVQL